MVMRDSTEIKTRTRRDARHALESALLRIAERGRLAGINVSGYRELGVIEGLSHELAHVLDLGPDFEASIREMGDVQANEHEAAALRVEVAALAALGVRLSARRLWATANWRDGGKIPSARSATLLYDHELDCVRRFVAMVRREMRIDEATS